MGKGKKDTGYLYKALMVARCWGGEVDAYWWALVVALEACSPPKYGMLHTSFLHHILHG